MDDPDNADTADETPEARLGAELRRLRVRAGLSVRGLAEELHRAHSGIVEYERGRRLAPVEVIEQYEEYFGLSRGELGAQRERARVERLECPRDGTLAEHLGEGPCPYKGLHAFESADAALFFGREAQVDRVLERLAEARFVAVVGASGSGKSSFVRAGLLTGIGAPADGSASASVALLTPGEHPLDALATAVASATGGAVRVPADDLRADPDGLERATRQAGAGGLAIAVDQFEELFTLCREEVDRRCFVEALIAAWRDPASPVVVIVALRADFYGRAAAYPELAAAVVAHQTLLGPMSARDLRRAIELPAAEAGLLLQSGLAETMLEDLTDEPGALPLLSHALLETWERRRRLMLTVGGYREAGGVRGAIAQTAERTLQSLPAPDRAIARSIFLSLTDVGEGSEPTRRRVDRAELAAHTHPADRLDRVLDILAGARLVSVDQRTVVVAHEALIRHWPRLRGWIEADRTGLLIHRRLTDAAREWDTLEREPAALYRGARLAAAGEWVTDHPGEVSRLEHDFLTASQATEDRELEAAKHRARRLRVVASGLAALTVLVAALALWALGQRSNAQHQAADATSLALTSASSPLLKSRPDVSLMLTLEAYRTSPRPEARSGALAALTSARDPGLLAILHGHTDAVRSVAFSRDGHTLASAGADTTVRLWDIRSHKPRGRPLADHTGSVSGVAFSRDGHTLAFGGADTTVRLWDIRSHKPRGRPLADHTGSVSGVAFSRDGRTLASASADTTVRLWDVRSHKQLGPPLTGHTNAVSGVAFSPDGRTLASAGADRTVRLWDVRSHEQLGPPLRGHANAVSGVAFSRDGRMLASAGADRTIRLWDVRGHKQLGPPLRGHANAVSGVAFSRDGRMLASAGADRTVRLWDVRSHQQLGPPLTGHTNAVSGVAFSPDGRTLASAGADQTIRLWDVRTRNPRRRPLIGDTRVVYRVAFDRDGRILASAGADHTIRLWDVRSHEQLGSPLRRHTSAVYDVAFSPDGRILASAGADHTVRLWDVRSHQQLGSPLTGHTGAVTSVAFSPDGRILASAGADHTVRLWDVRSHQQLGSPHTGHTGAVTTVAFSPDGRSLASAGADSTIRLWNVHTHEPLGAPLIDADVVYDVAFSRDGRTLASASGDHAIRLWDIRSHTQRGRPLTGHGSAVTSVAFSPDGRTLASAGRDETIRLWDVGTHEPLGVPLTDHADVVRSVVFTPGGRTLASAGNDEMTRLWENILWRNVAELQTEVCNLVGTGLSKSEWAQYAPGISYRQSCP